MQAKNLLALLVTLAIGFGLGLLVAGHMARRAAQSEIDDAVRAARAECDARLRLATAQRGQGTVPGAHGAPSAPSEPEGVTGSSGQEMIEKLLQQKGSVTVPSTPPAAPAVSEPASTAQDTPPAQEEPGTPYPKVLDYRPIPTSSGTRVEGMVKNMGLGECRSGFVEVLAMDARGVVVGRQRAPLTPANVEGYGTARFETTFPSSLSPTGFSCQPACQ